MFTEMIKEISTTTGLKFSTVLRAILGQELKKSDPFRKQIEHIRKHGHGEHSPKPRSRPQSAMAMIKQSNHSHGKESKNKGSPKRDKSSKSTSPKKRLMSAKMFVSERKGKNLNSFFTEDNSLNLTNFGSQKVRPASRNTMKMVKKSEQVSTKKRIFNQFGTLEDTYEQHSDLQ